ncbi:MAG: class I SAM-dependent methyltransferase [Magnetococcales bacterium]|nr:class I SAM-dependent methyltransferase [Magnetococcales bacterium]
MKAYSSVKAKHPCLTVHQDADSLPSYRIVQDLAIPSYLEQTYWWAYIHPNGVRLFERQWLVNLILWGNFAALRDVVLDEVKADNPMRVLQVACVYGDFTPRLSQVLDHSARLDVVDVAPVQLANLSRKLGGSSCEHSHVHLHHQDSTALSFRDDLFDQVILFFLLHEQPAGARSRTLLEALRVTKPGGRVIIVDYHGPHRFNPFRYIMWPILAFLEPFAMDLWKREINDWIPRGIPLTRVHQELFFGGLYQKVVMTR